jgi:signal transduction histidine kinase
MALRNGRRHNRSASQPDRMDSAPLPMTPSDDELLRWVARATAPLTGPEFFRSVVRSLALAFSLRRAFVAECIDTPVTRVRTLGYWFDGELRPDFEFNVAGTPCEATVRDGRMVCIVDGLREQFPGARRLDLDGYLGAPIHDARGERLLGHVAFETRGPLDAAIADSALFRIFLSRTAAELRRKRAEERERLHLQQLARVGRISAMGEMASAIAHEVNQPLAALRTNAQACLRLLAQQQTGELSAALERMAAQAERAGEIIRRLRGFMAREAGEAVPVAPNDLVAEVVDLVHAEARRSGIRLDLRLTAGLPHVCADPIQVEQVVVNLVRNAIETIEHVNGAQRWVAIATRRDGADVVVSVEDSGPGVDPALAERVFEPFFTTKEQGMGIGLSISRSIAEAHGGRLSLDARQGGGALFHLRLPATRESR